MTVTRGKATKTAAAGEWRFISHNVWGVGGPLPLTTPEVASRAMMAPVREWRDAGARGPLIVCVQEAWTTKLGPLCYVLSLACLAIEHAIWMLDALLGRVHVGLQRALVPLKLV